METGRTCPFTIGRPSAHKQWWTGPPLFNNSIPPSTCVQIRQPAMTRTTFYTSASPLNRSDHDPERTERRRTGNCPQPTRSEEHTSELQSRGHLVCRLLLEKKKND